MGFSSEVTSDPTVFTDRAGPTPFPSSNQQMLVGPAPQIQYVRIIIIIIIMSKDGRELKSTDLTPEAIDFGSSHPT